MRSRRNKKIWKLIVNWKLWASENWANMFQISSKIYLNPDCCGSEVPAQRSYVSELCIFMDDANVLWLNDL